MTDGRAARLGRAGKSFTDFGGWYAWLVLRYGWPGVKMRWKPLRCAGGRIAGAAAWFPPGTWSPGTEASDLTGFLRAFGRRVGTAAQFQSVAIRAHPRDEPHWYLAIIGVDPARKGHGVGAALLRSRLRRCDQDGVPAYLESSNQENVPLYQHFGFRVTSTLGLPEGAPVVHTMWRPGDLSGDAGPART